MRMSSMPNLSMAMRSMPRPKAKPVYSSGSYFTDLKTSGCIMPAPSISSQPLPLQTLQPEPAHMTQRMSISALGSVKGKKLGLNRISVLSPNRLCRK